MTKEFNWELPTEKLAAQISTANRLYAINLFTKFHIPEEDWAGDWYRGVHQAIDIIKADPKLKKTKGSACVFGYRKLADIYRNEHTVKSRYSYEQTREMIYHLELDIVDRKALFTITDLSPRAVAAREEIRKKEMRLLKLTKDMAFTIDEGFGYSEEILEDINQGF